jgi:hypothetical protein
VLLRLGRVPGFSGRGTLKDGCGSGTVFENVVLETSSDGREITDAELGAWVASFPIEVGVRERARR